jgi:hypothetical protein
MEWTLSQLDEYNVHVVDVAALDGLSSESQSPTVKSSAVPERVDGTDSVSVPEGLLSDGHDGVGQDGLVTGFFDSLKMIQTILDNDEDDEVAETRGLEGYTRQLVVDFVRSLISANMDGLNDTNMTVRVRCVLRIVADIVLRVERRLRLQG